MSAAAAAILDGMPDPARHLHRLDSGGGQTAIFAGRVELSPFAEYDTAMWYVAAAALRQLGFAGHGLRRGAGLTPSDDVATLHQRAVRGGDGRAGRGAGAAAGDG